MASATSLDRRVRKEAKALLARSAAVLKASTISAEQKTAIGEAVAAVKSAGSDGNQLRATLPALDAAVDKIRVTNAKSSGAEYIESIAIAIGIALLLRAFVVEAFKIPSSSMYPTLEIGDHIFVNKLVYGMRVPITGKKLFNTRSPQRGEVGVFIMPCKDNDYIKRIVAVAGDTVEVRCEKLFINGKEVPRSEVPGKCTYQDLNDGDTIVGNRAALGKWKTVECRRFRETLGDYTYDIYQQPAKNTDFPRVDQMDGIVPVCSSQHPDSAKQVPGKIVVSDPHPPSECSQRAHYVVPDGHVFAMGDNRDNSTDSRFWGALPIDNMKGKAMFIWMSFADWSLAPWTWRTERMGNFVH